MNILVAGASGYIGRELGPRLKQSFPDANIILLSRSEARSEPGLTWKKCDLFSLKSIEACIPGRIDVAYYLVHSMGPTAQLDQGSFADYDLILADNFGRALKKAGVGHLIYLGGLLPPSSDLSLHLKSRWEVEETFRAHNLPMTVFRAGLIVGEGGSSTQILLKLVHRLPFMICPSWTQTQTSPVDLPSVLSALSQTPLDSNHIGRVYDLAGCQPLSYLEMMRQTARRLNKKRLFLTVPLFSAWLSRIWVSLVTNSPRPLVYPLIQSLAHPMVARPAARFPGLKTDRTYFEMISALPLKTQPQGSFFPFRPVGKNVRSVQRLPLPPGKDAQWVCAEYMRWLPRWLWPWVRVTVKEADVCFALVFLRRALLDLQLSKERSTPDRQLLYIRGGLLQRGEVGRLEFREVLDRKYILAAVHEFHPALPWLVYKYTQALAHRLVMRRFARHLLG